MGQNQALHRAESQAVQANATPLHLNKEMAADQLAERVQVMMSKNLKNIDIRLDPPEMGRMHIRMNMQGDGATVHFTVANQHARDALEQTMPRLREMLAQQGVQLGIPLFNSKVQDNNSVMLGKSSRVLVKLHATNGIIAKKTLIPTSNLI